MLDIVFIMLIFFIVTTSFTNDDIWMNKRNIELREVRAMVERAKAENPEGSVVIVADRGSRIGTVTQVMDQVKLAGIQGIAISAEPEGG